MGERKRLTTWLVAGATAMTVPAGAQPAPEAAPAGAPLNVAPPPVVVAPTGASLNVGERPDFTRLSFQFPVVTTVTPLMTADRLELRFSRAVDIDLAEVRADLPRFVRAVTRVSQPGQPLRVQLTLEPGIRQRHFVDGERVVVDLLPPEGAQQAATTRSGDRDLPETSAAPVLAPAPTGNGALRLVEEAAATQITVRWPSAARAAAFRRGEAIWILFEANGNIDLRGVARAGRRHRDLELVRGEGLVGLRIPAAPDILVSARADGNAWTFTLGPRAENTGNAAVRLEGGDGASLVAEFGRTGVVRAITDPEVGDRILVALLAGPAVGVDVRRSTLEAAMLPSAQGAVIEPRADGVGAMFEEGRLVVSREAGLITAGETETQSAQSNVAALEAALIAEGEDGAVTSLSNREIRDRIDDLTRRAAAEGVADGAPTNARLALARFLLDNELAAEAMGALRLAAVNQPAIDLDPEYRLMRAAANVMLHRPRDADADLRASVLADNPSAALWRGYAAAMSENWADARRELDRGRGALESHPPNWRARFALALAQSALELNDFDASEAAARAAIGQAADQSIRLHARLVEARLLAARGRERESLVVLDELARVRDEEVAVRATFEAIRIRRTQGAITLEAAADQLEALRYRWRGDGLEVRIVGALGAIYAEMERWRESLAAMRVAADRFPNAPESRRLFTDMQTIFTRLFLEGEADGLEPIQALGLFYEFNDLTPIGPDGDRIVRALAGRLVAVDLLEQAASLLQHQVDERLEGMGRAQVASELAAVYLMDGKPEQALLAINSTRQPNMPTALLAERRILEARAHLDLGRLDHAVELVERDQGVEAQRVRAQAAWRARDWERAAVELRSLTRMRGRATPLDEDGRQVVLRAAIALTLAGDEAGVRTLYREHAGDMAGTPDADAFEIVAAGVNADGASAIRDVARAVARADLLDRFLGNIRARMAASAPPTQQAAVPAPPAPTAAAAPASPAA